MGRNEILLQLIFVLLAAVFGGIGGAYIQNQMSKESLESELVIIDMHLEIIDKNEIINKIPYNIELKGKNGNEINYSFLEVNTTVVNSVYSKYPLKIVESKIDIKGGDKNTQNNVFEYDSENISYNFNVGEPTPIISYFSTEPIYPSKNNKIVHYITIPFKGNYSLNGQFEIWYYDPMSDQKKHKIDEVFTLIIKNGELEEIIPLMEYVTIKGYKMGDTLFMKHG